MISLNGHSGSPGDLASQPKTEELAELGTTESDARHRVEPRHPIWGSGDKVRCVWSTGGAP